MSQLLSQEDLIQLTGAKWPSKQAKILRASGVPFVTRLDGRISVTWLAVSNANKQVHIDHDDGFDLGALNA